MEGLIVKQEDKVLSIILNKPNVLNALNLELKEGLLEALEFARKNPNVHAVLISGAGRSFSSGGNLKEIEKSNPVDTFEYLGKTKELILAMSQIEKPIIGCVHGNIAGGGCCLALACDIIFAAEDSKFHFSFSKVGLIPDNGGMFFLTRTIGLYRTKDILFTAQPISAETALNWGMINRIYPKDNLFSEAMGYALKLSAGPSFAIGQIKKLANLSIVNDLEAVLEMERSNQAVLQTTFDHNEGVNAFLEKRQPKFKGR
ncbi:enoyl-CoA hydratase/isomerase family protein [Lysinibacillus yapensis]|uniref:enoyl-CoA hydratase/isomerase family protein n=1 Tax=Ureibacillus yapensis TaxID=2304605 RepID=UPI001F3383C9|nr:enoyl-CoA hydratase-related protein [Lysinibacillus yapensis]